MAQEICQKGLKIISLAKKTAGKKPI